MRESIMNILSRITDEECALVNGTGLLNKNFYSRSSQFRVERDLISTDAYGNPISPVMLRIHTRFTYFPPHTHDFIELMYVCRGNITHIICGEEIALGEGDIIILGQSATHSVKKTSENDIGINMFISTGFFSSLCNRMRTNSLLSDRIFEPLLRGDGTQLCVFHTAGILPIENLIESMVYSIINDKEADPSFIQTEFELLTCYLSRLPETLTVPYGKSSGTEHSKRVLLNYIRTTYKSANLSDAAALLNLTPTYFSRWAKRNFGISFKQLLMNERFSVAVGLLTTTTTPVSEIISDVGYENSSYFHKQFRERYGTTPKVLRERTKAKGKSR